MQELVAEMLRNMQSAMPISKRMLKKITQESKDDIHVVWIHAWLKGIYDNEYAAVMNIWNRLPPDTWANYDLMEITGLAEQEILATRREALIRKFHATYPWKETNDKSKKAKNVPGGVSRDGIVDCVQDVEGSVGRELLHQPSEGSDCPST